MIDIVYTTTDGRTFLDTWRSGRNAVSLCRSDGDVIHSITGHQADSERLFIVDSHGAATAADTEADPHERCSGAHYGASGIVDCDSREI